MVTGLAAADAINALGMRHELLTEAASVCRVTSLTNCLHYNQKCNSSTAAAVAAAVLVNAKENTRKIND